MSDLKSRKSFILIVFFLTSIVVRSQSLIIDTTFGDYGINFLGTQSASSVKMQSDGRILVLSQIGNQGFIHRFESSGTPDLTFGSSGTLAVASQIEVVFTSESIVLQPDGKILVLGTRYLNGPATFCVARYTSSGILDNSFGTNGIKVIDINPNFDEDAAALCLQNDGKILLAGSSLNPQNLSSQADFLVTRLNSNGSLDNTFGTNGSVIIDNNNERNNTESIVIQPDGKIVITGWTIITNSLDFKGCVVRLNSNGTLDTSFDNDGRVTMVQPFISVTPPFNSYVQPDGKLVLAHAMNGPSGGAYSGVIRLNTDGALDPTFGDNGVSLNQSNGFTTIFYALAPDMNNGFITTGRSSLTSGPPWEGAGICKGMSNGLPDLSFDNDGSKTIPFDPSMSFGTDICFAGQDTLLIVGYTENNGGYVSRLILSDQLEIFEDPNEKINVSFSIYPNPVNDKLTILSESSIISNVQIKDASGKNVYTNMSNFSTVEIDVTAFETGVYFVECIVGGETLRERVIITNF